MTIYCVHASHGPGIERSVFSDVQEAQAALQNLHAVVAIFGHAFG